MNEIDFIPEWYKADRIRKRKYVRQSTIIVSLFVGMMLWSFIVGHHVQSVSAEAEEVQEAFEKAQICIEQSQSLSDEIDEMRQMSTLLDRITPRTKLTAIIGELSSLIRDNIILSKLSLKYEPIENPDGNAGLFSRAVVQVGKNNADIVAPEQPSRLKVVLTGIASQPAAAAALIARLEDTQYFEQVDLVYSKPEKIRDEDVTEFEIECYVADYRICNEKES